MSVKKCAQCGGIDRYKSGRCKQCEADKKRRYRERLKEAAPKLKVDAVQVPLVPPVVPEIDLHEELSTSKTRLAFMVRRHQQTLNDIDREMARLDQCLSVAAGSVEQRFYTSERRKLLEARMAHDQRLSKEIAAFQELVSKDDNETPITFMHVAFPPREWVETGCIGDTLDLSEFIPERADAEMPVSNG